MSIWAKVRGGARKRPTATGQTTGRAPSGLTATCALVEMADGGRVPWHRLVRPRLAVGAEGMLIFEADHEAPVTWPPGRVARISFELAADCEQCGDGPVRETEPVLRLEFAPPAPGPSSPEPSDDVQDAVAPAEEALTDSPGSSVEPISPSGRVVGAVLGLKARGPLEPEPSEPVEQCMHDLDPRHCTVCKDNAEQQVHVSDGGFVYHKTPLCPALRDGQGMVDARLGKRSPVRKVSIRRARELGRRPCKVCMG